jgi:hypothetical protein
MYIMELLGSNLTGVMEIPAYFFLDLLSICRHITSTLNMLRFLIFTMHGLLISFDPM